MSTAAVSLAVLFDPGLETEHQTREDEGEDDAVPGLDVFHHDLAVVQDEVVLQLPAAPPAGDDEAVEETVGQDGVQNHTGGRSVTAGMEDVVVRVCHDTQGGPSSGTEGSEPEEEEAGQEKGGEKLVEGLSWEEGVEDVESSHPHHYGEQRVQVDEEDLHQGLRPTSSVLYPLPQGVFQQVHQDLHVQPNDVEDQ